MSLNELREHIDQLDRNIIQAIGQRIELSRKIAQMKKEQHLPILDEMREEQIRSQVQKLAKAQGISPLVALEIIQLILDYSRIEMEAL